MKWLGYIALVVGGTMVIALSGTLGKFAGKKAAQNYREGRVSGAIEEMQAVVAEELRKQLPIRIDEVTTLQSVVSAGELLVYSYSLDHSVHELDKTGFIMSMQDFLKKNSCSEDGMVTMIKSGARYAYIYKDATGAFLGKIEISDEVCGF